MPALSFQITHRDAASRARVGRVTTPHGSFDTPAFMPVGTQGTVKGIQPAQLRALGAQIILGNTYHLMLRPGSELVAKMGGLQEWTNWRGPMLTDSGGFQVFSLSDINRIGDDGVTFKSHLDGSLHELTPERSIAVQNQLGADIIMAFDDCPPGLADAARVRESCDRSLRWLGRSINAHARPDAQALFGIVQGGTDLSLRTAFAAEATKHDLPGFAIGGVAVGEGWEAIKAVVEHTAPLLPDAKPRYLMGVGYERDILMAVRAGVDMFDCVLPTRNGRNAYAFTSTGALRLRNAKYAEDPRPLEEGCDCPACGGDAGPRGEGRGPSDPSLLAPRPSTLGPFSRSYLRHLFLAGEMLGPILVSAHNLRHFQRYLLDIRRAITENDWSLVPRRWPVVRETVL